MKVLYLVTAYPREPGDVITPWLVETIHRLAERGVEVEVLAPSYRALASQTVDGVRVHRFRYAPRPIETLTHDQTTPDRLRERPWYAALLPGYLFAGTAAARRLAGTGRFDVLHAFWPIPHGLMALAAKRASGVPLVSTFFGVELTWLESDLPVLRPLLRRVVRESDAVTAISSYTAAKLSAAVPQAKPVVIPFGAAVGAVEPHADAAHLSERANRALELLFVGRLVERKGVSVLLRALAFPGTETVRLTVVGDGPLRLELEAEARVLGLGGRVRFDGGVTAEVLAERFDACDALVLPAVVDAKGDTEGLGVVLLEAMQHGKPVIASGVGGITDIVIHEQTGLLVPPSDPAALAAAIHRLGRDPALACRLAHAGRVHAERRFGWVAVVDALVELYATVSAGRFGASRAAPEVEAGSPLR